jgi:alkaline phosphatase
VTDCHYADADPAGTRFYRQSLDKLTECVALMNAEKVDFLIELGDFKDQDKVPAEQKTCSYLEAVEQVFQDFEGPTYHVLGNHDMDSISKKQFLARVENTGIDSSRSYYSFDLGPTTTTATLTGPTRTFPPENSRGSNDCLLRPPAS